jgi:hypothetical protein
MKSKKIVISFLFSIVYGLSFAQILDDSTKQVYSNKTVRFILEQDILNNQKIYYSPDTTLTNFHLFDFNLRSGQLYQDLGNIGTAIKPLFFTPPTDIAKKFDYSAYGIYALNPQKATYFNTKSPYTRVNYVQSGGGTGIMHFIHSQNIKPQLNTTLEVRRLSSSKQYGAPQAREERLVDSWAVMFYTNYKSKNEKYIALANYNHFNHTTLEQGGIKPLSDTVDFVETSSLGNYRDFLSKLTAAAARDWRNEWHIYHQYKLSNNSQVYHILDYQHRRDSYIDTNFGIGASTNYFINPKNITDTLSVNFRYRLLENKIGMKGVHQGLYAMQSGSKNYLSKQLNIQLLAGAWANYTFSDSTKKIFAEAEIGTLNALGDMRLEAAYTSPRTKIGISVLSVPPSILEENFSSIAYSWSRMFANSFTTNLHASGRLQRGRFLFFPSIDNSLILNYIYYDSKAQIRQDSSAINLFRLGLGLVYQSKKLRIANQFYYTANTAENRFPTPKWSSNITISYELMYAKRLRMNTGFEIYYRSAYYANNYMPLTRQFFLQNQQKVWGTPVADVFVDLKINQVRLFFKFAHVNQGFPSNGYYVSPSYPGLKRTFFLGLDWPLFD